jgi:transposase
MKVDGRTLSHETSETIRVLAVRRVRDGERPSDVMRSYGLCRTTIYPWLRAARRRGEAALQSRPSTGRPPALTARQKQQVRRWICGKDPRQHGFDFGLWTRQIVASLIEHKFKLSLGVTAVGRLLAELEITPQKPLRRAYERDPVAIAQWKAEGTARRLGVTLPSATAGPGWRPARIGDRTPNRGCRCRSHSELEAEGRHLCGTIASAAICSSAD